MQKEPPSKISKKTFPRIHDSTRNAKQLRKRIDRESWHIFKGFSNISDNTSQGKALLQTILSKALHKMPDFTRFPFGEKALLSNICNPRKMGKAQLGTPGGPSAINGAQNDDWAKVTQARRVRLLGSANSKALQELCRPRRTSLNAIEQSHKSRLKDPSKIKVIKSIRPPCSTRLVAKISLFPLNKNQIMRSKRHS